MTATDQTYTEDDYFRHDDHSAELMELLAGSDDPAFRSDYLRTLAGYDAHRSRLHEAVFGPDPDEDGTPAADWLADSARLLWIVAEAEHARESDLPMPGEVLDPLLVDDRHAVLRDAARAELDEFAEGGDRLSLLGEMVDVWLPVAVGQAVESIACIPVPDSC